MEEIRTYIIHAQDIFGGDYYYKIKAKNVKSMKMIFKNRHPNEMIIEYYEKGDNE